MGSLEIRPAGDAAIVADLGDAIDLTINRRVHAVAAQVKRDLASLGPFEVIPAYTSLLVCYDPSQLSYDAVADIVRRAGTAEAAETQVARLFSLPVVYGGGYGPDLDEISRFHGFDPEEVIRRHAFRDYPIFCLGFSPGFPFLGELDESLHTPRLETPRPRVPAGSVAIGGSQTGVYPTETPGGWRIIGRTPVLLYDVRWVPPVPFSPGDLIRFVPIDEPEYARLRESPAMPQGETVEL